jgi:hypothetical protein
MQPQLIDHIADMTPDDLRTHLRNAYGNTTAQAREIEMLHRLLHKQKEQRDALLAACRSVVNWSQTYVEQPATGVVHLVTVIVPAVEAAIYGAENPGTITIYNLPACDTCGDGFTPEQWEDRHDGHEPGCGGEGCDCDLVYHAGCCPECGEDDGEE